MSMPGKIGKDNFEAGFAFLLPLLFVLISGLLVIGVVKGPELTQKGIVFLEKNFPSLHSKLSQIPKFVNKTPGDEENFANVLSPSSYGRGRFKGDVRIEGDVEIAGTITLEEMASFLKGAEFGSSTLSIDEKGNLTTDQTITTQDLSVLGTATLKTLSLGSLTIAGNPIINASGKIPAINGYYFENLNGENLTNVNAHHLNGAAASSFLRGDESDTAHGAMNFTASPSNSVVSGGPLYINPAASTANYTLLGVAVNNSQKFKIDAEGDIFITGSIDIDGSFGCTDCINFDDLSDTLALDTSTNITLDESEALTFTNSGTGNIVFNLSSTGDFDIQDNGTSSFFVSDGGNVGIGTTGPGAKLEIIGIQRITTDNAAALLVEQVDGSDIFTVDTNTPQVKISYDGDISVTPLFLLQAPADDVVLKIESTLVSGGSADLKLIGSSNREPEIHFGDSVDNDRGRISYPNPDMGTRPEGLWFYTDNKAQMGIHTDGKIGFKYNDSSWTPSAQFHFVGSDGSITLPSINSNTEMILENSGHAFLSFINNTTSTSALAFGDTDNQLQGYIAYRNEDDSLRIWTNGSEVFKIDSGGKVAIGTQGPDDLLHISGASGLDGATPVTAYLYSTNSGLWTDNSIFAQVEFGNADTNGGAGVKAKISAFVDSENAADTGISFYTSTDGINIQERMRIDHAGNVGIGTTAPGGKLHVATNTTTLTGKPALIVDQLESEDLLTASASGTTKFVIDESGNTFVGNLAVASTTAVCFQSAVKNGATVYQLTDCDGTPADLAEWYPADTSDLPQAGEIVSIGKGIGEGSSQAFLVEKASKPYDSKMIGVVSTKAFEIMGEDVLEWAEKAVAVGLVGRLPVKISPSSSPIKPGDFLTSSETPGYAIKAEEEGYTIGKALGSWTPESGKETILVYLNQSVSLDKTQIASTGSDIEARIGDLEAKTTLLESSLLLSSGGSNTNLDTNNLTLTDLAVLDNTVLSDTVINGKLTIGTLTLDNLENSIDAIGTLKIQPLQLGDIEFLGGKIKMNKEGDVVLDIKGGIRLNTDGKQKPKCSEETRGTQWFTQGKEENKDSFEVCAKDKQGEFEWRILY